MLVSTPVSCMLTAHPTDLFTDIYGFSIGVSGLCYIGLGLGFLLATIFGASFADRVYLTVCAYAILSTFKA